MSNNRNNRRGGNKSPKKHSVKHSGRKVFEELTGTVSMSREGYGFIRIPDREEDIFVSAKKLRGALNNDTVKVAVIRKKSSGHRTEGGSDRDFGKIPQTVYRDIADYRQPGLGHSGEPVYAV